MNNLSVLRVCLVRRRFINGRTLFLILLALLVTVAGRIEMALAVPLTPPPGVTGKEYSHFFDEDATGLFDSEQTIFWDGIGGAVDTFDFTPPALGGLGPVRLPALLLLENEPETDALANSNDQFFGELRGNITGLIFSTDGDGSIYSEDTAGAGATWATALTINAAAPPHDVDAIEVWGPDPPAGGGGADDAFNYSLESTPRGSIGLPDPGPVAAAPGIAVWHVPGSVPGLLGATAFSLLTDIDLAGAIAPLAPGGGTALEHELIVNQLDLDGMMLNIDFFESNTADHELSDRIGSIHFTIDPIEDESGGVIFDGGEIFTWDFTLPGLNPPASFLFHGGHFWDTAFGVMAMFGTVSENVNGLESVAEIPEPTSLALIVTGAFLSLGLRRRRPKWNTT